MTEGVSCCIQVPAENSAQEEQSQHFVPLGQCSDMPRPSRPPSAELMPVRTAALQAAAECQHLEKEPSRCLVDTHGDVFRFQVLLIL